MLPGTNGWKDSCWWFRWRALGTCDKGHKTRQSTAGASSRGAGAAAALCVGVVARTPRRLVKTHPKKRLAASSAWGNNEVPSGRAPWPPESAWIVSEAPMSKSMQQSTLLSGRSAKASAAPQDCEEAEYPEGDSGSVAQHQMRSRSASRKGERNIFG